MAPGPILQNCANSPSFMPTLCQLSFSPRLSWPDAPSSLPGPWWLPDSLPCRQWADHPRRQPATRKQQQFRCSHAKSRSVRRMKCILLQWAVILFSVRGCTCCCLPPPHSQAGRLQIQADCWTCKHQLPGQLICIHICIWSGNNYFQRHTVGSNRHALFIRCCKSLTIGASLHKLPHTFP
jgi:hypothetical protein